MNCMSLFDRLSSILSLSAGYRRFSRAIRGRAWETYLAEYVKPVRGEKVLDIGCGPADILAQLPDVDYTGLDISPDYIEDEIGAGWLGTEGSTAS